MMYRFCKYIKYRGFQLHYFSSKDVKDTMNKMTEADRYNLTITTKSDSTFSYCKENKTMMLRNAPWQELELDICENMKFLWRN